MQQLYYGQRARACGERRACEAPIPSESKQEVDFDSVVLAARVLESAGVCSERSVSRGRQIRGIFGPNLWRGLGTGAVKHRFGVYLGGICRSQNTARSRLFSTTQNEHCNWRPAPAGRATGDGAMSVCARWAIQEKRDMSTRREAKTSPESVQSRDRRRSRRVKGDTRGIKTGRA